MVSKACIVGTYQTKLEALRSFVEQLKALNIQLVPVSEAMRKMHPPA